MGNLEITIENERTVMFELHNDTVLQVTKHTSIL